MKRALRLAVLGDPIDHSRSPAIHQAAMRACGFEGTYEAIKADTRRLSETADALRAGTMTGINVTMPLKREAAALSDLLTPEAAAGETVNAMRLGPGGLEGHSTDVVAYRAFLERFETIPILVLGGGGAATAALVAAGDRHVYVATRSYDKAAKLVANRPYASAIEFGTAVVGALVINATPLGMHGEALPSEILEPSAGLIDLAYGPDATPATLDAKSLGITTVDGIEFLVEQAIASFEWWTGVRPPRDALLVAARKG